MLTINRSAFFVLAVLLLFMTGCRLRQEEVDATPTPFGTWSPVLDSRPVPADIGALIDAPESYEGAYVQVSGVYERLPLLVCGSDAHPSPVTWQLSAPDGRVVGVHGREAEMRRLLPDGLWMTANGRMTYFEGAIGCGKRAKIQQFWYLSVDKIISPNPIVPMTLTPVGFTAVDTPMPTAASTPTVMPTATSTPAVMPTATPVPTVMPPPSPSPSVTETAAPPMLTVTPVPSTTARAISDMGEIELNKVLFKSFEGDEQHQWVFDVTESSRLTVTVVGDSQTDLVIVVKDAETDAIVKQVDVTGAGTAETLLLDVEGGQYQLVVFSADGEENGRYTALYSLNNADVEMNLSGLLPYEQMDSASLDAESEQYWVFEGEKDEVITITVTPLDGADMVIQLLNQTDDVDDTDGGEAVEISAFTLPADGLYVLKVGEYERGTAVYTIKISK